MLPCSKKALNLGSIMNEDFFEGIIKLYGKQGLKHLSKAHFLIVGIGGVGSWAAEALARSGAGKISLIDLDDICMTNINRQVHSLVSTIGQPKVNVMAKRLFEINPDIQVNCVLEMLTKSNIEELIGKDDKIVIDCIDSVTSKCHLVDYCYKEKIPLVVVGGAGGHTQPDKIEIADLSETRQDKILWRIRKRLKQNFNFPREGKWDISAIFIPSKRIEPSTCEDDIDELDDKLNCQGRLGSASFVTGSFGFFAASEGINLLFKSKNHEY
jgi:tRNA A37 threonylcarbamoyladenosine dehydratase